LTSLYQIEEAVLARTEAIASAHPDWPCRKGCADCCRSLAEMPRISAAEWARIDAAFAALPTEVAEAAHGRIRQSAGSTRPIVCPLLDTATGACLIYEARPTACREYAFYAERQFVLGCHRIEAIAAGQPDVIWGNHAAIEQQLDSLGPRATLAEWLDHPSADCGG
jgi:Fe-S-cluster containining protein